MNKNTEAITSYEVFDVVRVVLGKFQLLNLFQFIVNVFVADLCGLPSCTLSGILLQMVVIATTTRLLQNMSPPKRAS